MLMSDRIRSSGFQLLVQTHLPLKAVEAIVVRESYRHVGMIPA